MHGREEHGRGRQPDGERHPASDPEQVFEQGRQRAQDAEAENRFFVYPGAQGHDEPRPQALRRHDPPARRGENPSPRVITKTINEPIVRA